MKKVFQVIFFTLLGFTILYLVYHNQQQAYVAQCVIDNIPAEDCSLLQKVWNDFGRVDYVWIGVVLFCFMASNIIRALRWNLLLEPLGYKGSFVNAFFTIMLGYFANLGFPRIGEVVRAGSFARYEGIPVEKSIGTVVTERIVDVIMVVIVMMIAFSLESELLLNKLGELFGSSNEASSTRSSYVWYIIGIVVILTIATLFLFKNRISSLPLYKKTKEVLASFGEGLLSIRKLRNPFLFILYSILIWVCYFLMTYSCLFSFDPVAHLGMEAALILFVFGTLGIIVPSPGGMGTFHFMTIQAMLLFGVSAGDGFSFANILFFSVQILCNVLFGVLALLILPIYNRSKLTLRNAG